MPDLSADYVIVGGGSAGCALAARVSEDPSVSVLLLEAGRRPRHPNIAIPAAFAKQFKTRLDWDYATEPEPHCDGRRLYVPRGRGLGGSSAMNAMVYVRGRPEDYDAWGVPGWGWDDVRPCFERSALVVSPQRSPRPLTVRWVAAVEAAGAADEAGLTRLTQRNGRRWSAYDAYLRPALGRPNLTVRGGAHVSGIEIEDGRAVGVWLGRGTARARREVVLAAGAIGSPQLLMLSGVGPADHLREVGIEPVVDAPGVGANLQDHPFLVQVYASRVGGSLYDAEHPRFLAEWLLRRSGPLTSPVAEAIAFVRSRDGLEAPDLQFHFAPAYFVDHGFADFDGHAFTFGPVLVAPRSRGWLRLRSTDPAAKPRILTNSLAEAGDVAALVAGVRLGRELARREPLAAAAGRELFPGPDVPDDDEALEADLRRRVELLYHPAGTCRMGAGDTAVVDPQLRVRGIDGLRVADASIFPVIPRGNTNAPTVMVAERAAELLRGGAPARSS